MKCRLLTLICSTFSKLTNMLYFLKVNENTRMLSSYLDLVLLILTSNIVLVVDFEEFIVFQTMITDGE